MLGTKSFEWLLRLAQWFQLACGFECLFHSMDMEPLLSSSLLLLLFEMAYFNLREFSGIQIEDREL